MTTDELDRTARHRPRPPLHDADAILGRVLGDVRPSSRARRRTLTLVGLAATVAAAAAVVPAVLPTAAPGGPAPAAAAELRRLSGAATSSGDDEAAEPGRFRHVVVTEHQTSPELSTRTESWTGADARTWSRTVTSHADGRPGRTETDLFPAPSTAGLPTDPDALQRYLVDHASGSNSTDEAVFSALAGLLTPGTSAALRSAATEVLARTGHVTLGPRTTDSFGRTVVEVDFVDEATRPGEVQAITFDTADARVTASRITAYGQTVGRPYYEASVAPAETTGSVPADVVRDAVPYCSEGCDDGTDGG